MSASHPKSTIEQYKAARREIDGRFPTGHFVAVEGGQVVADAPSHRLLVEILCTNGKNPKDMLVVQAGVQYPESAVIF